MSTFDEFNLNQISARTGSNFPNEALRTIFPEILLQAFPQDVLISQVTHFCRCGREQQPAVCFSIPDWGDYSVPLTRLPNRMVLEIGTRLADTNGVLAEWWRISFMNVDRGVSPPTTLLQSETSDLYPEYVVRFLRHFCVIQLHDGSFRADYIVCCSIQNGARVLCGLHDMYSWHQIFGLARLPDDYAAREAKRLNAHGQRGLMKPIYELFSVFRDQEVLIYSKDHKNQNVHFHGNFEPSPTPSAIFHVGEVELTQDRVVFLATATEIDRFFAICRQSNR